MIYDYDWKKGYISLWIGRCRDYSVLDDYLSTVYLDEDYIEGEEPGEEWKRIEGTCIFFPENQDRPCEEELRKSFNYEFYNLFEYDFGLSFDEDFREAAVRDKESNDLEELFRGFSFYDTFIDEAKALMNDRIPKCNAAVALYDFRYDGGILRIERENISLYFLGYVRFSER